MKKKIILSLLIVFCLLVTGCNNMKGDQKETHDEKNIPKMSDMCHECRFLYTTEDLEYGDHIYNFMEQVKNTLDENETEEKWEDIVSKTHKKVFLGVILSDGTSGRIERVFACAIKNEIPFCVEATKNDEEKNEKSFNLLQILYDNKCTNDNGQIKCSGEVNTFMDGRGGISISYKESSKYYECGASSYGGINCTER